MVKPWASMPSATSPATSVIFSPTAARKIRGVAVGIGPRIEHRGHEGMAVERTPEGQPAPVRPAGPDGPDGQDQFAHPGGGMGPRHGEPLLDVGLDLGPEAEHEPALRQRLEIVGHHGQVHRIAGEGHGDSGAEHDPFGVLGRQDQREEGIVGDFGRPDAVVADPLGQPGRFDHPARIEPDAAVDVHGPRYPGCRRPTHHRARRISCVAGSSGPTISGVTDDAADGRPWPIDPLPASTDWGALPVPELGGQDDLDATLAGFAGQANGSADPRSVPRTSRSGSATRIATATGCCSTTPPNAAC